MARNWEYPRCSALVGPELCLVDLAEGQQLGSPQAEQRPEVLLRLTVHTGHLGISSKCRF